MAISLAALALSDGSPVQVEMLHTGASAQESGDEILGGTVDDALAQMGTRIEDAVKAVQGVLGEFEPVLAQLNVSELEIEFGVSLSAETGWFVGRAGGEAALTIRATLRRIQED